MTKIVKAIFGGTDDSAQDAQIAANALSQAFTEERGAEAAELGKTLFSRAEQSRRLGTQAALDVFGQTIPQRLQTFQAGNIGAQKAQLAGLPQIQAALLGQPIDFSQFRSRSVEFDPSFAQQRLPQIAPQVELPQFSGVSSDAISALISDSIRGDDVLERVGGINGETDILKPPPITTQPPTTIQPPPQQSDLQVFVNDIIAKFQAGELSIEEGSTLILNRADTLGLTASQLAAQTALTPENITAGLTATNRAF